MLQSLLFTWCLDEECINCCCYVLSFLSVEPVYHLAGNDGFMCTPGVAKDETVRVQLCLESNIFCVYISEYSNNGCKCHGAEPRPAIFSQ